MPTFWQNAIDGFISGMMGKGPNHIKRQRAAKVREQREKMGNVAYRAYQKAREDKAQQNRDLQYVDDDFRVRVKNGYSRDYDCYVTDILICPRDSSGNRQHVIIDEGGTELYNEFHEK